MRKSLSVVVCLFIFLMLPEFSFSATIASPRTYISVQTGVAILTDSDISGSSIDGTVEFDPGSSEGFAVGANFNLFRVEGEIGYQLNSIDEAVNHTEDEHYDAGDYASALTFLVNGYLNIPNPSRFTPYITGGVGIAYLTVDDLYYGGSSDDTVFAYQVGAGVGYALNKNMSLDLKYRYFATADPEFEGIKAEVSSHNLYFCFRYNFN